MSDYLIVAGFVAKHSGLGRDILGLLFCTGIVDGNSRNILSVDSGDTLANNDYLFYSTYNIWTYR